VKPPVKNNMDGVHGWLSIIYCRNKLLTIRGGTVYNSLAFLEKKLGKIYMQRVNVNARYAVMFPSNLLRVYTAMGGGYKKSSIIFSIGTCDLDFSVFKKVLRLYGVYGVYPIGTSLGIQCII